MRWLLAFVLCAALLVLGGCGGGDDSSSTSSTTTEATTASTPPSKQGEGNGAAENPKGDDHSFSKGNSKSESSGQGNKDDSSSSKPHPQRVKVPPISSTPTPGSSKPAPGVKTVKDGDNSVQEYGVESDSSERREAAIALQAYLNARAEEDWSAACSLLGQKPMQQ